MDITQFSWAEKLFLEKFQKNRGYQASFSRPLKIVLDLEKNALDLWMNLHCEATIK